MLDGAGRRAPPRRRPTAAPPRLGGEGAMSTGGAAKGLGDAGRALVASGGGGGGAKDGRVLGRITAVASLSPAYSSRTERPRSCARRGTASTRERLVPARARRRARQPRCHGSGSRGGRWVGDAASLVAGAE
jgi:hypothetical protein